MSKAYDPSLGKGNNLSRQIGVGETPLGVSKDCIDDYLCAETGLPVTLCNCPGHTTHTGLLAELNNRDPRLLQTVCSPETGEHTYYLKGHPANIATLSIPVQAVLLLPVIALPNSIMQPNIWQLTIREH